MNNTPEQIERFECFRKGWERRSALWLDIAGAPQWLIQRRCHPPLPGWGTVLDYLISFSMGIEIDLDDA